MPKKTKPTLQTAKPVNNRRPKPLIPKAGLTKSGRRTY